MSSDDYQVQNIYRYSRKSFKKSRSSRQDEHLSPRDDLELLDSPRSEQRSEGYTAESPGCSCDIDTEGDIANILHKKCPVISLAQQQLQRLLDGTEKLLCDNTRCCRSIYDFLCLCREVLTSQNKTHFAILLVVAAAFAFGLILGSASCGTYLGRFNSPILGCIDSYFIADSYPTVQESLRSIV